MLLRIGVRIIAFLLIAEALFGALRLATVLPQLGIYDAVAMALVVARGGVGALQFAGGWMLANHRPAGPVLARSALIAGSVVTVLDAGLRLAPSGVPYWYRWQFTGAYLVYAVLAILLLSRHRAMDSGDHGERAPT